MFLSGVHRIECENLSLLSFAPLLASNEAAINHSLNFHEHFAGIRLIVQPMDSWVISEPVLPVSTQLAQPHTVQGFLCVFALNRGVQPQISQSP